MLYILYRVDIRKKRNIKINVVDTFEEMHEALKKLERIAFNYIRDHNYQENIEIKDIPIEEREEGLFLLRSSEFPNRIDIYEKSIVDDIGWITTDKKVDIVKKLFYEVSFMDLDVVSESENKQKSVITIKKNKYKNIQKTNIHDMLIKELKKRFIELNNEN